MTCIGRFSERRSSGGYALTIPFRSPTRYDYVRPSQTASRSRPVGEQSPHSSPIVNMRPVVIDNLLPRFSQRGGIYCSHTAPYPGSMHPIRQYRQTTESLAESLAFLETYTKTALPPPSCIPLPVRVVCPPEPGRHCPRPVVLCCLPRYPAASGADSVDQWAYLPPALVQLGHRMTQSATSKSG